MRYDFDKVIDRSGTYSEKWKIKDGELPMWVADMDFETAPEIKEEILKRATHGVFGYSYTPDEWYDAYISWWDRRYDYKIEKDSLLYSTGVIPTIAASIRELTDPGDKVLLLTPVYNGFFGATVKNGRIPAECALKYNEDHFEIDWDSFEEMCSDPETKLLLFCNPHNPTGNMWTREEMVRVGEICERHNVIVISDEIHCDITEPGTKYIPFASINDTNKNISITCIAPSKTFNIAGLFSSAVSIPNKDLYKKVRQALRAGVIDEPNAFAIQATVAAYNLGEPWLEELREYIFNNKKYMSEYIAENIPQIKDVSGNSTYLSWVDVRGLGDAVEGFGPRLRKETGLWIVEGLIYGKAGIGYLRINAASPRSMVEDGMERLKQGVLWDINNI